jgi:hypothetical protein
MSGFMIESRLHRVRAANGGVRVVSSVPNADMNALPASGGIDRVSRVEPKDHRRRRSMVGGGAMKTLRSSVGAFTIAALLSLVPILSCRDAPTVPRPRR